MNFVASILYAVCTSVLLAIVLGLVKGGLSPGIASISLATGALAAAFSFWHDRLAAPRQNRRLYVWEWGVIIVFVLFSLRAFLWLVFPDKNEIKVLSPNNLGDLSLHLTYIHQLANGGPFWPDNPIVAGTKLTYPLGVDLFNSLLVLVGADTLRALIWVGLSGCLLLGIAIWRWGGAFTLAGFLCNGGLAGFVFLRTGELMDYQSELAWKSLPLALLVTQRGLLFALPVGLLLLCSWRNRYFNANSEDRWMLPLWGELLLYASMPVFHLHTFLFLSFVLLAWFIFPSSLRETERKVENLGKPHVPAKPGKHRKSKKAGKSAKSSNPGKTIKPAEQGRHEISSATSAVASNVKDSIAQSKTRPALARFVGLAFIPASALVFLVTGYLKGPSVIGWHLGWMQNDPEFLKGVAERFGTDNHIFTIPFFWILNFGILPFLVAALVIQISRNPAKQWERAVVFPALGVFALCCIVRFAPWEWDNTKLMVWSYLAILPILWTEIIRPWPVWLRGVVCFGLFWSGFISLIGGLDSSHRGFSIATRSELDQLAPALKAVPPGERFIAHPNYNHPLLLLGRPLVLGYTGHVWSHGYDWQEKQAQVQSVLTGQEGWREQARAAGARYLFWGSQEREAYPDSSQPWREQSQLVARGEWGEIYDLSAHPPGQ